MSEGIGGKLGELEGKGDGYRMCKWRKRREGWEDGARTGEEVHEECKGNEK